MLSKNIRTRKFQFSSLGTDKKNSLMLWMKHVKNYTLALKFQRKRRLSIVLGSSRCKHKEYQLILFLLLQLSHQNNSKSLYFLMPVCGRHLKKHTQGLNVEAKASTREF